MRFVSRLTGRKEEAELAGQVLHRATYVSAPLHVPPHSEKLVSSTGHSASAANTTQTYPANELTDSVLSKGWIGGTSSAHICTSAHASP